MLRNLDMCHGQELDLLYYWNDNGINLSGNVWSSWLSGNWCWFALSFVIGSFPRDPGTNGMTAPTMVQICFPWCFEIIRKVAPITLARDLQISDLRVSTKRCNQYLGSPTPCSQTSTFFHETDPRLTKQARLLGETKTLDPLWTLQGIWKVLHFQTHTHTHTYIYI